MYDKSHFLVITTTVTPDVAAAIITHHNGKAFLILHDGEDYKLCKSSLIHQTD